MSSYQYVKSDSKLIIFIEGKPYTVSSTDKKYGMLSELLKNKASVEAVKELLDKKIEIRKRISKLGFEMNEDGEVFYKNVQIPLDVTLVINAFYIMYGEDSEDVTLNALQYFVINLMQNPDYDNITDLYSFLQKGDLPITNDGHFLAYKVVRSDFMDKHTGTMNNGIGKTVWMERSKCDLNRNNTCSSGLHFCSRDYINGFYSSGDKIVEVKINPKNVTSIPADYNQTKGRCCEYMVTKEIKEGDLCGKKIVDVTPAPTPAPVDQVNTPKSTYQKAIETATDKAKASHRASLGPIFTPSKVCSKCKQVKLITEFNKDASKKDGHRSNCRVCK